MVFLWTPSQAPAAASGTPPPPLPPPAPTYVVLRESQFMHNSA